MQFTTPFALLSATLGLASPLAQSETVWSHFGEGYGYIPLVLPIAGLIWLRRTRPRTDPRPEHAGDHA